jgi:hypothetical protein
MADKLRDYQTSNISSASIGQAVDEIMTSATSQRKSFERRWYDNNFFDDGFHFRYLSRTQNKIVDLTERQNMWAPIRAIPKASRQIRGVANLLVSRDFTPTVYPERISKYQYPSQQVQDPNTGEMVNQENPEYKLALEEAKRIAKSSGHWLEEEMRDKDLPELIAYMVILAAKHSVSYLKIWPDAVEEKIKVAVRDAFDIYLAGSVNETEESPYLIDAVPKFISEIKANEQFDEEQLVKINPDNKQASSEIKNAYMTSKYGRENNSDSNATLIQKESFLQEYMDDEVVERLKIQYGKYQDKDSEEVLTKKKKGDRIIRHSFTAGNIGLYDRYTSLPSYPYADFRFEPGPIYQVPLIERFIPANKSLDMLISRGERIAHTMVVGTWLKSKGQSFNITNQAGGQVIEYEGVPPTQGQMANIPSFFFELINFMQSLIEEQGVSTSTLGKLPTGVKANAAIESLKESEYANLVIADRRLKQTVKKIAQKFLDIADDYFTTPKTVYYLEKGEPQYYDVIGASALKKREEVGVETPKDVVPLKKDYKVEIEISTTPAYTRQGQREVLNGLMDKMIQLATAGLIPPEAIKAVVQQFLDTYQFGATSEIMDAIEDFGQTGNMEQTQIDAIKVALMEVFKDLKGSEMFPDQKTRIDENKVAALEVMKDTGGGKPAQQEDKGPSKSISFKDLPAEGKVQLAAQADIQLSPEQIKAQEAETQKVAMANAKAKVVVKPNATNQKQKG